jgi:hypothetical protein
MPSPLPFALLAHLALAAASPQAAVEEALTPGRRAEVAAPQVSSGRDCRPESWSTLRPTTASGPAALRFAGADAAGRPCEGFAWAKVTVLAPTPVVTRALEVGDPLEGGVAWEEREVRPGRLPPAALPEGATAARRLRPGAVLEETSYRVGPRPGTALAVVLSSGALSIEQVGRSVPCSRGRACAVLPSGRRVEGRLADGRILVEVP